VTAPIWTELWIGAGPRNPHPNFRSGLVGSAGSVKATSGTRLLRPTAAYFPVFALAALTTAHRFFVAVMIAFLPAAESFRLGFGAAFGAEGRAAFLEAAHLLRCASAIAFLPAALIFLRFRFDGSDVALGAAVPPESI